MTYVTVEAGLRHVLGNWDWFSILVETPSLPCFKVKIHMICQAGSGTSYHLKINLQRDAMQWYCGGKIKVCNVGSTKITLPADWDSLPGQITLVETPPPSSQYGSYSHKEYGIFFCKIVKFLVVNSKTRHSDRSSVRPS